MGWVVVIAASSETEAESPQYAGKQQPAVLIKGRGTDVAFKLDESAPLEDVVKELDSQLAGQAMLFSRGGISINTGNRRLSDEEKEEIRRIFREKSGLKISRFISTAEVSVDEQIDIGRELQVVASESNPSAEGLPAGQTNSIAEEPPVRRTRKNPAPLGEFSSADLARALSGLSSQGQRTRDRALVVRGTVRSGETVEHHGDLIVLGDVNPGSEILAEGDIVVMGSLKGLPHAGAAGDSKAAIIALEIAAPRLRIGGAEANAAPDSAAVSRDRKQSSASAQPQMAYIRQGRIHIAPFAGRFARYTKGVPYEG